MPIKKVQIRIKNKNRQVFILAPVKDSLHGSLLSDRINKLPYLKVYEREFIPKASYVKVKCDSIIGKFSIEQLHLDLETMSDLIILENESLPHPTARN